MNRGLATPTLYARFRRCTAVLALVCFALPGCYRLVEIDAPGENADIDAVRFSSGDLLRISAQQRAAIEESDLMIRSRATNGLVRRISSTDIQSLYREEVDVTRTILVYGSLLVGGLVVLLYASELDEPPCESGCLF